MMRSLRFQLLASHVLLVMLMAVVMGVTLASFVILGRAVGTAQEGNVATIRGGRLVLHAIGRQRESFALLLSGQPTLAKDGILAATQEFRSGLELIGLSVTETEEVLTAASLSDGIANLVPKAEKTVESSQIVISDKSRELIRESYLPSLLKLEALAGQLVEANEEAILKDATLARQTADSSITRAAWVTVVTILVAVLLAIRIVRMTLIPLATLAKRASQIAEGDLSPGEAVRGRDEIGRLADSFEDMASKLAEVRRSEVRRLQRAERMSDAALEYLYDPVIVVDGKARIVHLNQAAEDLFGSLPQGKRVPVAEHLRDRRLARTLERASLSNEVSAPEDEAAFVSIPTDGRNRTYRIRTTPMRDDDDVPLGSVAVLEDVTHLRELDRLKNEFIGVASHELRTPVASLLLSAQLLRDGAGGDLTDSQREIVTMQLEDLERLEKLTRDLLDVTKLETGVQRPKTEPVPPFELANQVANSLRVQAERKGLTLEVECTGSGNPVAIDRSQIGRVLTNLVANAIRHTQAGGKVQIIVDDLAEGVRFSAVDTGEGIPTDYQKRIFERFVQVPGATQGGAGLGLSIASSIVEAHGGKMTVESEVGKGSTFRFEIPRHRSSEIEEGTL